MDKIQSFTGNFRPSTKKLHVGNFVNRNVISNLFEATVWNPASNVTSGTTPASQTKYLAAGSPVARFSGSDVNNIMKSATNLTSSVDIAATYSKNPATVVATPITYAQISGIVVSLAMAKVSANQYGSSYPAYSPGDTLAIVPLGQGAIVDVTIDEADVANWTTLTSTPSLSKQFIFYNFATGGWQIGTSTTGIPVDILEVEAGSAIGPNFKQDGTNYNMSIPPVFSTTANAARVRF